MKSLHNLIAGIFRKVNNLYLHWLEHRDASMHDWIAEHPCQGNIKPASICNGCSHNTPLGKSCTWRDSGGTVITCNDYIRRKRVCENIDSFGWKEYYRSKAEIVMKQIERYNRDCPVEMQFNAEEYHNRDYPIDNGT